MGIYRRPSAKVFIKVMAIVASQLLLTGILIIGTYASDVYGPTNLFKTLKTPFGSSTNSSQDSDLTAPISFASTPAENLRRSLSERLNIPHLYLPPCMTLGQTAEFTVKGRPGSWAALAMADKNSGAKPLFGHTLRLGADRKVVALGKIPDSGILLLDVETPIQGDLIGDCLYFEAAIWSRPDCSDVVIAIPVTSENTGKAPNGVLVSAEQEIKKGLRIGADTSVPMTERATHSSPLGFDTNTP